MEISEIKRIVELLKKVNCERIALISEVANSLRTIPNSSNSARR